MGAALLFSAAFVHSADAACRQALALGLDVSGSVDPSEYQLQLRGVANALTSEPVRKVLLSGPDAPVRIAVYEWSGPSYQSVILDWTEIQTADTLDNAKRHILSHVRGGQDVPSTALGSAVAFGAAKLRQQTECWKRTLDISGDGKSNTGPRPIQVTSSAVVDGITVNGLVVGTDDAAPTNTRIVQLGELSAYFGTNVAVGANSFVETALGFQDYERAMIRKLLRELDVFTIGSID